MILEIFQSQNYNIFKEVHKCIKTSEGKEISRITKRNEFFYPDDLLKFFENGIVDNCNKYNMTKKHCGFCWEPSADEYGNVKYKSNYIQPKKKYGQLEFQITFLEKRL